MKHETTTPSSIVDRGVYPDKVGAVAQENTSSRCQQRTPAGRRCRRSVFDSLSGLCRKHSLTHQKQRNDADFAAALTGQLAEFKSASDINQILANLFVLLAQNRISARRAAVLAYITNQLLRTLAAMDAEANAAQDAPLQIIFDAPRPDRDEVHVPGPSVAGSEPGAYTTNHPADRGRNPL